jgi:murein DD-endopeptidase MepM/ murein hydrolase activator NlpD
MRNVMKSSNLSKFYVAILLSALCFPPISSIGKGKGRITWSENTLNVTLPSGGQTTRTLTFTSDQALENIVIEPVPTIARFVSVQPASIATVPVGQPLTITLNFSAPQGTKEGLYDGTIHVRRGAATIPEVLKVGIEIKNSSSTASNVIPPQGGSVNLPGTGSVVFPSGAFGSNQLVELSTTNSPETAQDFQESVSMFRVSQRLPYEIRVTTGNVRPQAPSQVTLNVPDAFINSIPPGSDIHLFAQIWQDGGEELLDNFELLPSEFDPTAKTVVATLPKEAFTNKRRPDGIFEAIFTLGSTPGATIIAPIKPAQSTFDMPSSHFDGAPDEKSIEIVTIRPLTNTGCQGTSLGSPLDTPIVENRSFNPAGETHPITGQTTPHYGADLKAANGDTVRAMADGKIEESSFQFNSAKGTGWGNYIVLRHEDGSATRYAHLLPGSLLPKGDTPIKKGDAIAQADTSGGATGPHLHVEYAPNGQIFNNANKVDPVPCIGTNISTSITVGDNGAAADDAFEVFLDGLLIGQTTIGGTNTIAAGNLRSGNHTLTIIAIIAPDNVGTLGVTLSDGVTFSDGSTTRSEVLPQGGQVTYEIIVPSQ